MMRVLATAMISGLLGACVGTPEGIEPVKGFELERYLGKWYEIARLDHRFERKLQAVTAEYRLTEGEAIRVINRGYNTETNEWQEAEGKAYFVKSPDLAYLRVSFFGPFYGAYVIFELDKENYQYAFVTGNSRSYLWLLARTPEIPDSLRSRFVEKARELGFATDELIFVEHGDEVNIDSSR